MGRATGRRANRPQPKEDRFKKGRSGNPKGRPKGAQGRAKIARRVLLEPHAVKENGAMEMRTMLELVVRTLGELTYKGNDRAFKLMQQLLAEYDPPKPDKRAGVLVVPGRLDRESWEEVFGVKDPPKQDDD